MVGSRKITIAVDGGINLETGAQCVASGADVLVAGSAIFKAGSCESETEIRLIFGAEKPPHTEHTNNIPMVITLIIPKYVLAERCSSLSKKAKTAKPALTQKAINASPNKM